MTALKKIGVELAALQGHRHQTSIESARFGKANSEAGASPNDSRPIQVYERESTAGQPGKPGFGIGADSPLDMQDLDKQYYKDSVDILGLSMNEME